MMNRLWATATELHRAVKFRLREKPVVVVMAAQARLEVQVLELVEPELVVPDLALQVTALVNPHFLR